MSNINYNELANADARFVLRLIENGEWERAHDHARLLLSSIKVVMERKGIEPMARHIHDTTSVA